MFAWITRNHHKKHLPNWFIKVDKNESYWTSEIDKYQEKRKWNLSWFRCIIMTQKIFPPGGAVPLRSPCELKILLLLRVLRCVLPTLVCFGIFWLENPSPTSSGSLLVVVGDSFCLKINWTLKIVSSLRHLAWQSFCQIITSSIA